MASNKLSTREHRSKSEVADGLQLGTELIWIHGSWHFTAHFSIGCLSQHMFRGIVFMIRSIKNSAKSCFVRIRYDNCGATNIAVSELTQDVNAM